MQLNKKTREQGVSEQWSNIKKQPTFEKGSIGDKLNLNNLKIDVSGKKMMNDIRVNMKLFEEKVNGVHEKYSNKF